MSYARFSDDSSVYVFLSVTGSLECCGCALSDLTGDSFTADSTDAMLAHLNEHREAGHKVPDYCTERLAENREANDAYLRGHKDAREGFAHLSHEVEGSTDGDN